MYEGQHDAGRELFHRDVGREVRADARVLLFEDVIDHPTAVRRLQQRMVEQEDEPAAGLEHPPRLLRSRVRARECARTPSTRARVERSVGKWPSPPRCFRVHTGPPPRNTPTDELRPRRVSANDELRTEFTRRPATTDLRPRRCRGGRSHAGEALGHKRDDLFLVLRVGAVGETVLPPLARPLPELGIDVRGTTDRCRESAQGSGRCGSRAP